MDMPINLTEAQKQCPHHHTTGRTEDIADAQVLEFKIVCNACGGLLLHRRTPMSEVVG